MDWRKPSQCADAACVEVMIQPHRVQIRSSDFPQIELGFTRAEWESFIQAAKLGEYDVE